MNKNQIITLNNLVFKIAQKQNMKDYLSIMNYSKYLEKEHNLFVEECELIQKKYKTEKKNYKNQQGQDIEYYTIPASMIDNCNDELKKVSEVEFIDKPKQDKSINGKGIFNAIINKFSVKELTGENIEVIDGKEVKVPNYTYQEQKILSEILN
jgi:hypothetical protein